MKKKFLRRYRSYSEEKLMSIITRKNDYQAEAVQAAKEELHNRNLEIAELDALHAASLEKMHMETEDLKIKKKEPLANYQILLFLLVPFAGLFWALIAYMNYDRNGYQKKARQSLIISIFSLGLAIFFLYLLSHF